MGSLIEYERHGMEYFTPPTGDQKREEDGGRKQAEDTEAINTCRGGKVIV